MNKILMIAAFVLAFGLVAASVSAECAIPSNNAKIDYNELSAGEFFYGIPPACENEKTTGMKGYVGNMPTNENIISGDLSAAEVFYGYPIPDALGPTHDICDMTREHKVSAKDAYELLNPAPFFGYADTGITTGRCINC